MRIFITFLIVLMAHTAFAQSFYGDRNRGWYAYEAEVAEEEKDEKSFLPEKPAINWMILDRMSPAEFSKLLDQTRDYALSYRTLENFGEYARMRNIAVRRAEEFASISTLWAQMNPAMTGESEFPVNAFGNDLWKRERNRSISETLLQERENYGLVYFYSDSCAYCVRQTPLIQMFKDRYGWAIESVNIGMAKAEPLVTRFGITSVPSIVLVERVTSGWLLVAGGIIELTELESRLYRSIRYLRGDSDENSYDFTNYTTLGGSGTGKLVK